MSLLHSFTSIFLWLIHHHHHVLFVFFLFFLLSKSILVGLNDALEVGVESQKDSSLEENLEEIVLLLELLVLILRDSITDVDIIPLVDGGVVDNIPEGNQEDGNQGEDDGSGQWSSGGESILDEPVDEESRGDVEWDQKSNGHNWEPPDNLIVENKEEVPGDVVEGKHHGKSANKLNTELDWAAAAAGKVLSEFIVANAHAAAALGEVLLSLQ